MACLGVSIVLVSFVQGGIAMGQASYHAVTLIDLKNPVPPEWLEKAGIDYVYASGGIPLETGPDGEPVIAAESREDWERVFQLYRGTGIKVLLMSQFYTRPPEGAEAVDFFGRSHKMACFRQQAFLDWMRETIVRLATAFGKYEAFGGFAFDDGVHVRVDCCYCDACRRLFNEQHGIEPPPFAHHTGVGRVPDGDPLLLWESFQRESFEIYLRTQSEAVRSVSEDLLMVTIPSDAYYFGRFLNVDVVPEESNLGAGALLQRLERIQLRNWYTFYTFPLARLPETTERGLQPWAAGTHITAQSARIMIQTEGPFLPLYGRIQYMSPTEIERMARVTVAEGAGAICFWTPGDKLPYYPAAFDGIAAAYRDIATIEELLASRRRLPASVGLLYSTTTEVFEQPWTTNTSQRWQHLHAFEGLAYSLLRSNLPFEVVMEDDLTPQRLGQLDALVLPAVRFITESAAQAIEAAVADRGLRAVATGPHPPLKGVIEAPCDPLIWHRWASEGYRQEEHLNEQWREVALHLVPLVRPAVGASVQVFSERVISRLYRLEGGDLLVMIANWDLHEPVEVVVEGRGRATDAVTGEDLGKLEEGRALTVLPAGWRVLRVAQQS
jgi:hypothetical protein